jgi:hypothetical protein
VRCPASQMYQVILFGCVMFSVRTERLGYACATPGTSPYQFRNTTVIELNFFSENCVSLSDVSLPKYVLACVRACVCVCLM